MSRTRASVSCNVATGTGHRRIGQHHQLRRGGHSKLDVGMRADVGSALPTDS